MVDKSTLLDMYKSGYTLRYIGEAFDISDSRVFQIIKRYFPEEALKKSGTRITNTGEHNSKSEKYIIEKLRGLGYRVEAQTYNAPFDLLVNGYKVEIKYCKNHKRYNKYKKARGYAFPQTYTLIPIDFFIFVCGKMGDTIEYILPAKEVGTTISFPISPATKKTKERLLRSINNWSILST